MISSGLCRRRFDAMQAVRGVFNGKKYNIGIRQCPTAMRRPSWNVNYLPWRDDGALTVHFGLHGSLQNVDPLFVGMAVRLGARSRRHAHQRRHHSLALDTAAEGGRVFGTAHDGIDSCEIE